MSEWQDLPESMRAAKRWLVYKAIPSPDGKKPRKVPYYFNGNPRHGALDSPEDIAQLGTFDEAIAALATLRYTGLGFALGPDGTGNYWQGVDLDGIPDRPSLATLRDDLPGYTERSPSGHGWHAIGYGKLFPALGSNDSGIEAYSSGRYFTVTADCAGLGEPCDLSEFVATVLIPLHSRCASPAQAAAQTHVSPETITDLRSALNALDADSRETWVAVGIALHELGPAGRELWLTWSQTSDKWQAKDAKQWDTFAGNRTGYQAIFSRAQAAGWVNPRSNAAAQPRQTLPATVMSGKLRRMPRFGEHGKLAPTGFVLNPIIPRRVVTLLGGHGGAGKTMLALVWAAHVATGRPWHTFEAAAPQSVTFLSFEDAGELVYSRLEKIVGTYDLPRDLLAQNLVVFDGSEVDAALVTEVAGRKIEMTPMLAHVRDAVAGSALIIADNASDTFDGDENNRRHVRTFMRELAQMAKANNAGLLLLAHIDKSSAKFGGAGNNYSGSTAWHNSARSRLALLEKDRGELELVHEKANLSGLAEPIRLTKHAGVPTPQSAEQRAFTQRMAAQSDSGAVLEAIRVISQTHTVPNAHSGTQNTAHNTIKHRLPEAWREDRTRFRNALDALIEDGRVIVSEYQDERRKPKFRLLVPDGEK